MTSPFSHLHIASPTPPERPTPPARSGTGSQTTPAPSFAEQLAKEHAMQRGVTALNPDDATDAGSFQLPLSLSSLLKGSQSGAAQTTSPQETTTVDIDRPGALYTLKANAILKQYQAAIDMEADSPPLFN